MWVFTYFTIKYCHKYMRHKISNDNRMSIFKCAWNITTWIKYSIRLCIQLYYCDSYCWWSKTRELADKKPLFYNSQPSLKEFIFISLWERLLKRFDLIRAYEVRKLSYDGWKEIAYCWEIFVPATSIYCIGDWWRACPPSWLPLPSRTFYSPTYHLPPHTPHPGPHTPHPT